MPNETPWFGVVPEPEGKEGFIYLIRNLKTGAKYLGKKTYWRTAKYAVKGKKRKVKKIYPTDWKFYMGSSKYVLADIEELGVDNFTFEILFECPTKGWLTYAECNMIHKLDALTRRDDNDELVYQNKNAIAIKFMPTKKELDEMAAKIDAAVERLKNE